MPKSLESIQQQIRKLQEQADVIKRKEAIGVIARIQVAIEAYGLTPVDLFGEATASPSRRSVKGSHSPVFTKSPKVQASGMQKKVPNAPKYTDGTRFWTGRGKRPNWFKEAIEAGKTPEDLAIKAS
jgi:DNA-binding protein H-NS